MGINVTSTKCLFNPQLNAFQVSLSRGTSEAFIATRQNINIY